MAGKFIGLTFPSRGTEMEVGGMISDRRRKNTVSDRRMLIDRETFSPESLPQKGLVKQ